MAASEKGRLATNVERLVEQSVLGEVSAPVSRGDWRVGADGAPSLLPGVGGITYNCKVGDSALDWEADHVEPGVSVKAAKKESNAALNILACLGNVARVVSGDAKGQEGVVTGKHGGIEHVLVDFPDGTLSELVVGDKVQIRARGLGLKLLDLPGVSLMNMSPELLERMAPEQDGERLRVRVAHRIPAAIMGSGLGRSHTFSGDYDIQLFDEQVVERCGLAGLKLGDIVAVEDAEHTFGRVYRSGAVSIGVVVHSRCATAGHGPGLTSLMSSGEGKIVPVDDPSANIAAYLKIGRMRPTPAQAADSEAPGQKG
ncbi:MAG: DUF4438 domain-containing protein [Planctomycetota bacterium]